MNKKDKELLDKLAKVQGLTYYLISNDPNKEELEVINNFSVFNLPTTEVQPTEFSPTGNVGNGRVVRFIPGYGAFVFVPKETITKLGIETEIVHPWDKKVDVGIAAMAGLLL